MTGWLYIISGTEYVAQLCSYASFFYFWEASMAFLHSSALNCQFCWLFTLGELDLKDL